MKLKIRNWNQWQSYRKDRGQPPWIKIHRRVMHDPNWVALSDAQRGQLIAMWMLAADRDGLLPNPLPNSTGTDTELLSNSAETIRQLCHMKHKPNLKLFIELGFIESVGAIMAPGRRHHDPPEKNRIDAAAPPTEEAELFKRGKAVLGNDAGGLIARLLKSKKGIISEARAIIEVASAKENPREYIGAVIRGKVSSLPTWRKSEGWH